MTNKNSKKVYSDNIERKIVNEFRNFHGYHSCRSPSSFGVADVMVFGSNLNWKVDTIIDRMGLELKQYRTSKQLGGGNLHLIQVKTSNDKKVNVSNCIEKRELNRAIDLAEEIDANYYVVFKRKQKRDSRRKAKKDE